MRVIEVKYLSPTNARGSRLKATVYGLSESVTVGFHNYSNDKDGYLDAAEKLKNKLGWKGTMYGGDTKNGMVFVFADEEYKVNPVTSYKGKYPRKIKSVASVRGERGIVSVRLNDGTMLEIEAKDVNGKMPRVGQDIDDVMGYRLLSKKEPSAVKMLKDLEKKKPKTKKPATKRPVEKFVFAYGLKDKGGRVLASFASLEAAKASAQIYANKHKTQVEIFKY